ILEEVPTQPRVQDGRGIEAPLVELDLAVRRRTGGGEKLERLARIPAKAEARARAGSIDIEVLAGETAEVELAGIVSDLEREVEIRRELALVTEPEARRYQVELVVDVDLGERALDMRADVNDRAVELPREIETVRQRDGAGHRDTVAISGLCGHVLSRCRRLGAHRVDARRQHPEVDIRVAQLGSRGAGGNRRGEHDDGR